MADDSVFIVDAKGTEHEFPAGFDPQRAAAIVRGQSQTPQSDSGALGLAAVAPAARELMRFGTSPNVPKYGSMAGRIIGAVAPPIVGGYEGGVTGGLAGAAAAAKTSWAGGKTGYFTGKMLQGIARPVSGALDAIAPAATALSGASGVGDLAQMAEPTRKDIGFLGMGPSVDVPGAEPPLLNAAYDRMKGWLRGKLSR